MRLQAKTSLIAGTSLNIGKQLALLDHRTISYSHDCPADRLA
jgi:hypothetical protein